MCENEEEGQDRAGSGAVVFAGLVPLLEGLNNYG
jgi:hypothetical protein